MAETRFKIEGVPPYDGEYPFPANFTNREFHFIKLHAGIRADELEEAAGAGDNDLVVVFACIALQRAGLEPKIDALWDAQLGKITVLEGDAVPLSETPPSSNGTPDGESGSSGSGSGSTSAPPVNGLSLTGSSAFTTPGEFV